LRGAGTILAHLMFDLTPIMIGTTARTGPAQWLAEAVATFGLILTIFGALRASPKADEAAPCLPPRRPGRA
jgi:hypothetical protein